MSNSQSPSFVHRRNRDGSYDSICSQCAATAATAVVQSDLREGEIKHICDQYLLETRRSYLTRPPVDPKPPEVTGS